ncbi:MAG: hypothetical protein QXT64_01280 [Desulfurococcaceae archaeon]
MKSSSLIEIAMKEAEDYYARNNIAVTLRGLFYILVSKNILPNTRSAYKRLSEVIAKARYEKRFPAYLIRDVTRASIHLEKLEHYPEELSEEKLKELVQSILNNYATYSMNPWKDQKKRVIILVEKEAQYELMKKIVWENFEFGVYKIVFSRGYDSATDMIKLAEEIKSLNEDGYRAVLLIITDFDPSGEDIARDYVERLKYIEPSLDFEAEKVAVTREQIERFNLPCTPESAEELEKLKRDSRFKKFVDKWGLVRVELDALVALRLDNFKQILVDSIKKHFDYEVYEKVTKKREEELKAKADEARKKNIELLKKVMS